MTSNWESRMVRDLVEQGITDNVRAISLASDCAKYFGTCPTATQFEYWFRKIYNRPEHQSVGIVAWDGDE